MSDPTRDESLSLLRWLLEAGAGEAIAEQPIDRFARPRPSPLPEPSSRQSATTRSTLPPAFAEASAGKPREGGKSAKPAAAETLSHPPRAARALAASPT